MGINGQFEKFVAQHGPAGQGDQFGHRQLACTAARLAKEAEASRGRLHRRLAAAGDDTDKAQRRNLHHDRLSPRLLTGT